MNYTIDSSFVPMEKIFGAAYSESLIIFRDNKVTWILDLENFVKHSQGFVEKVSPDLVAFFKYRILWNERTETLRSHFATLSDSDLTKCTDVELVQKFHVFSEAYYEWWAVTMSIELITVSIEPALGKALKTYFPDEHPKEYNNAFALLTSPLALTFYREEQRDLLLLSKLPQEKLKVAVGEHVKRYHWIYNSYLEGKRLDSDYFSKQIKKIKTEDVETMLTEIEEYSNHTRMAKVTLLELMNASEELLDLVSMVETASTMQDERKADNFKADGYLEDFVQEFARRSAYSVSDLKLLRSYELGKVFERETKLGKLIQDRKKAFVIRKQGGEEETWSGKESFELAEKYATPKQVTESMIHGVLASPGEQYYFRGTAKVILDVKELDRLADGEILVTTMTSPDFVIGMRRAGAIITDEGGITSHAAIVARELKKPCIVGTKIATKVIKDGDVVELHCGRGTIKVVKI